MNKSYRLELVTGTRITITEQEANQLYGNLSDSMITFHRDDGDLLIFIKHITHIAPINPVGESGIAMPKSPSDIKAEKLMREEKKTVNLDTLLKDSL